MAIHGARLTGLEINFPGGPNRDPVARWLLFKGLGLGQLTDTISNSVRDRRTMTADPRQDNDF